MSQVTQSHIVTHFDNFCVLGDFKEQNIQNQNWKNVFPFSNLGYYNNLQCASKLDVYLENNRNQKLSLW